MQKRIIKAIIMIFLCLILISCGNSNPSGTVRKLYRGIDKSDLKIVGSVATQEYANYISGRQQQLKNQLDINGKIRDITQEIEGNTAIVTVAFENGNNALEYLERTDGKWRVAIPTPIATVKMFYMAVNMNDINLARTLLTHDLYGLVSRDNVGKLRNDFFELGLPQGFVDFISGNNADVHIYYEDEDMVWYLRKSSLGFWEINNYRWVSVEERTQSSKAAQRVQREMQNQPTTKEMPVEIQMGEPVEIQMGEPIDIPAERETQTIIIDL